MDLLFPHATKSEKKYPNKIHDVDHLFAHSKTDASVFVTSDGPILRNADKLLAEFGIKVSSLNEFLDTNGWAVKQVE